MATSHAPSSNAAAAVLSTAAPVSADDPALAFDPPARLRPTVLAPGERVPLLLVLHGFGVSSGLLVAKAGLESLADQRKFAYLSPQGNRDRAGRPFWNAGASCCDFEHQGPDDVKRLRDLLAANVTNAAIDPARVFVIGYSNGAFMAQRLACDAGAQLAGVISVAGAAPSSDVSCMQSSELAFLEIHGDADPIVHYAGGTVFDRSDVAVHPSATQTADYWAKQLSCAGAPRAIDRLDLEPTLPGRETSVQRFDECHGSVEL